MSIKKIWSAIIGFLILTGCIQQTANKGVAVVPTYFQSKNKSNAKYNFGDYHALLIYVDDYTYLSKLETPKYDIEAIEKILKNRYGFKKITIVANPKNSDELVEILDKMTANIKSNDNLLIYYAGHGYYIQQADAGFWQLRDAKENSRAGWISVKQAVNFTLNQMSARHILVVSDSCYSGAIFRKSGAKLASNREDIRYYTQLYQKKSRTALTSGALEPVLDADPLNPNNSIFLNGFRYVLENNKKPIFVLEEKFSEIKRYIKLRAEQTPQYSDIVRTNLPNKIPRVPHNIGILSKKNHNSVNTKL